MLTSYKRRQKIINKFITHLTSLGLAIVLFILIATYSIIGTVLPQGMGKEFYIKKYNSFGNMINTLQLDKVYSSFLFRALLLLFIINLVGCTLKILPAQLHRMKKEYFQQPKKDEEDLYTNGVDINAFSKVLEKKGYKITHDENGYKASKHRIGNIGSSITHLGIVIIILSSFIGNLFSEESFFNMLPGDIKSFPKYNFSLRLDKFYLGFRDNGTVEQYYSDITVISPGQQDKQEKVWVNKPLEIGQSSFYQTSYGWASKLSIKDKNGEIVLSKLLRNKESHFFQKEHLTINLYGYYPDFVLTKDGEPISMSERENNPFYAVVIYQFNNHIGSYVLEPGQPVKFGDYEISFDDSTLYTGITYRKDYGYLFVLIGSILLIAGLIFSFYFYPKFVFVQNGSIKTSSRQNSWGFNYQIRKYVEELTKKKENN